METAVNLILKPILIALKFTILLIIRLVDSFYFLEILRNHCLFVFFFLVRLFCFVLFFLTVFLQTGLVSIWVFGSALGESVIFPVKTKMPEHTVLINSSPIDFFLFDPQDRIYLDISHEVSKTFLWKLFLG